VDSYPKYKKILKGFLEKNSGVALFLLFMLFIALAFWSWRKWPDILIDFGHELYIPWQLASGKVLFRDIAHIYGPFSQYFNALIFYLFGTSFINLVFSNLLISLLLMLIIYFFFKKACDQYTAIFSCMVFLTFFGFAHFTGVGNYNWVCPYSHELTHGIVLSCVMLLIFQKCFFRLRVGLLALAGVCLGFILLTKMEVGLASLASALVGIALIIWTQKPRLSLGLTLITIFFAGVLIPIVGCLVFLGRYMPLREVFQYLSFSWRAIFETPVIWNKFYLECIGLDSPLRNIVFMGAGVIGVLLFACAAIVIDVRESSFAKKRRVFIILPAFFLVTALTIKFFPWLIFEGSPYPMAAIRTAIHAGNANWLIVGWALPPITLISGASLGWLSIKRLGDFGNCFKIYGLTIWAVFSFVLLAKILLHPRLYHFGFALAMPATLLMVACFMWLLPKVIKRFGGTGFTFRRVIAAALLIDIFLALIFSYKIYSLKFFNVGQGGDRIVTYQTRISLSPSGPSIAELLKQIENLIPQEGNFAVIPEGIMINYLSRRPNPIRNFESPYFELMTFGETSLFKSLSDARPDLIIIIPIDTTEFGFWLFGEDPDHSNSITAWIPSDYEKVWQENDQQQPNNRFGISILRRKIKGTY